VKGLRNGGGEGGEMKQEVCIPGEGAQTSVCWDLPGVKCTHTASGRRAAQSLLCSWLPSQGACEIFSPSIS